MARMAEFRPIEPGDRFEDLDYRSAGRIIEIRSPKNAYGKFQAQVEVHPSNPSAVGRHTSLLEETIRTRFRRISR